MPEGAIGLWNHFVGAGRFSPGPNGPDVLGWIEIETYDRVTRAGLDPWEMSAVRELSTRFVNLWHQLRGEESEQSAPKKAAR